MSHFLLGGDWEKYKLDKKTIYSKTGKGVLEIKNKAGKLSKDLVKVLTLVDGKSTISDLMAKSKLDDAEMDKAINQLSAGGYIKEFANTSTGATSTDGAGGGSYVDDLDFTASLTSSSAKANPYQSAQTEWRQRESADRAKAELEAKRKREEEDKLKKEQAAKQAREEAARLTKVEAERKAKEAAALKQREESERKAKIEAEAMAQTTRDLQKILEKERLALEESEKKRQEEAARKAQVEVEARSRDEAERKRREDEERKRKEEEERKRREEEERKRKEEEERKRREEQERKRREEEEQRKRREEEERKRREEEERKRREEEERKRKEEEERKRREEEERRQREEEERKRKEEEERKRRQEEEERQRRREEEDLRRREEDERRRREDEALESRKREESELRRAEEDSVRRAEDERRRQEDEARRGEEEERRRREEEEAARRREEDDRRRREEEDSRRREEEERSRAAASAAAAKSDLPEFDISGLKSMEDRIAAEFEKQQEAIRKREEEEERRREQDEQARLAIERAEREEEARAEAERREAEDRERRERMEQERAEREERERKRQEEKEQRIREAEERKIAAAHERQRQEEMRIESERRAREEALASRRKEQEERDRKRAEVDALKKTKAIRSPLDVAKPFIIGVAVLAVLLVGGVQLVPMNSYIPALEKLASDHIKEPVTIGSMKVSILSGFTMNLENVKIGTTQDVKIDRVSLAPEFGSVFGNVKVVRRIDVDSVSVAQEVLPRLPRWLDAALADKTVQVGRIVFKGVKLESPTVKLPAVDADLHLDADGRIEQARLTDGKLDVELKSRNGEVDIEISASKGWVSPVGPAIEFTDFSAKGVVSRGQIRIPEFKALLYGGAAKGSATVSFAGPWSMEGEFTTERINLQELMAAFTREAKSSGQLESRMRFSMSGADLPSMFAQPRIDGSFTVRKGDVDGIDLVRALQTGGRENVQGGATRFEEITGTLALAGERYQYRNMKLASGLLSASGAFDVSPGNDISGRIAVELRSQAAQIRGNYAIGGALKAIVLKPN